MRLSFRKNILFLVGIPLLIATVIGGIGSYVMLKNAEDIRSQYNNIIVPTLYLEEVASNFWKAYSLLLSVAIDKTPDVIQKNLKMISVLYSKNDQILENYQQTIFAGQEEETLRTVMVEKRKKFHSVNRYALELELLASNGNSLEEFFGYSREVMLPALHEFMDALGALNGHVLEMAAKETARNQTLAETAFISIVTIITVAVLILLVSGYYFSSGVMKALAEETNFATAIAGKNFNTTLEPSLLARKDELGVMANALETMRSNLLQVIGELRSSDEAARKASRAKGDFLSRMSHEIRTPLNAIIGMTYIARKARDRDAMNTCLDKIAISSSHLLALINDILDISKIEAGKLTLVAEKFDLEKLLMDVCTVVSAKVDEKEQQFLVTLESDLRSCFIGDGLRLSQVLTNLLSNACKFTPARGIIRLVASCVENNGSDAIVRFTVADNGIGMTKEQLSRIFSPFEQADGSITRQFGGTGLGLVICEKIVRLMDGDIHVESSLGHGSTFIVSVKLKNSGHSWYANLAPSIDTRQFRAVVVDKSDEARQILASLFEDLSIAVATADSPAQALNVLRESKETAPVTVVLFDWETGGRKSADFVKAITAEPGGRVSVAIMISGSGKGEIEELAEAAGACTVLSKPVFPSMIVGLINDLSGEPDGVTEQIQPETWAFTGKRLLLVEDNPINREIALAYLENTGITVDEAENGAEAVEKFMAAREPYDLIVMDLHMPVMDGYTASRRIRAEENNRDLRPTPIVAMTADAFKEDIARCLEVGMNGHLAKPINLDIMMLTLSKYLAAPMPEPPAADA